MGLILIHQAEHNHCLDVHIWEAARRQNATLTLEPAPASCSHMAMPNQEYVSIIIALHEWIKVAIGVLPKVAC